MDKEIKNEVLEMLKQFMMGEHGKRLKPTAVSVEVIKPKKSSSLEDVLDDAQEEAPEVEDLGDAVDIDGDGDHDEDDHKAAEMEDEEDCEPKKIKSFRDFFNR
jgi:hypothetical protein